MVHIYVTAIFNFNVLNPNTWLANQLNSPSRADRNYMVYAENNVQRPTPMICPNYKGLYIRNLRF
jgi:hypothetical protein